MTKKKNVIYPLLLFGSAFLVSELQSLPSIPKQEHELPSQGYAHPRLAAPSTPKGLSAHTGTCAANSTALGMEGTGGSPRPLTSLCRRSLTSSKSLPPRLAKTNALTLLKT